MPNQTTSPNSHLRTSLQGVWLIKKFEGLRFDAYRDESGVATIGWGHTKDVRIGDRIDDLKAEMYLLADLEEAEDAVKDLIDVPLTQYQFDALIDFTFNFGYKKLSGSTLRRKLNEGNYQSVPEQLGRWVYIRVDGIWEPSTGLIKRRKAEGILFRDGTLQTDT